MKEHFLTLFLAVTTTLTLLVFHFTGQAYSTPVFNADEILFEHQTVHGNIVLTSNAYDEISLSFLTRNINGFTQVEATYAVETPLDEVFFLSLPSSADIPFTIYAVVSNHPELHQIIVTESNTQIAHSAHQKTTTCEHPNCSNTAVFLVASTDLTGADVLILGLDSAGAILVEIEMSQQSYDPWHS